MQADPYIYSWAKRAESSEDYYFIYEQVVEIDQLPSLQNIYVRRSKYV